MRSKADDIWAVNEGSAEVFSTLNDRTVVQFSERFTKQEKADASLIAAAPELLKQLKWLMAWPTPNGPVGDVCIGTIFAKDIRKLIAKAEGKK